MSQPLEAIALQVAIEACERCDALRAAYKTLGEDVTKVEAICCDHRDALEGLGK